MSKGAIERLIKPFSYIDYISAAQLREKDYASGPLLRLLAGVDKRPFFLRVAVEKGMGIKRTACRWERIKKELGEGFGFSPPQELIDKLGLEFLNWQLVSPSQGLPQVFLGADSQASPIKVRDAKGMMVVDYLFGDNDHEYDIDVRLAGIQKGQDGTDRALAVNYRFPSNKPQEAKISDIVFSIREREKILSGGDSYFRSPFRPIPTDLSLSQSDPAIVITEAITEGTMEADGVRHKVALDVVEERDIFGFRNFGQMETSFGPFSVVDNGRTVLVYSNMTPDYTDYNSRGDLIISVPRPQAASVANMGQCERAFNNTRLTK